MHSWRRVIIAGIAACVFIILYTSIYLSEGWYKDVEVSSLLTHSSKGPIENNHASRGSSQPMAARQGMAPVSPQLDGKRNNVRYGQSSITIASSKYPQIWPNPNFPEDDRLIAQLKYIPKSLHDNGNANAQVRNKEILLYNGFGSLANDIKSSTFEDLSCPVSQCSIVTDREFLQRADVVLFQQNSRAPQERGSPKQIWVMYLLEAPPYTPSLKTFNKKINWTATYRADSTIVTPYEKLVPNESTALKKSENKNYAAGKTKLVAWFTSHCQTENERLSVAKELARYIEVDIYGYCGNMKCPRRNNTECFKKLNKDYKFYLSFENSNCINYITEKYFLNGLKNDIIPIVMGARPDDYRRASPPHSYIHVEEFSTIEELAKYLHLLDQNDTLYNEYFRWKGSWGPVDTKFWCRLCALAHDSDLPPSHYEDIEEWWNGKGVCIGNQLWTDFYKILNQGGSTDAPKDPFANADSPFMAFLRFVAKKLWG